MSPGTAPWSRKLSIANLKNDYEREEINFRDSKHKYKKNDDQYLEYKDEEEYNNYIRVCQDCNHYNLCQECNNCQQLKAPALLIPRSHRLRGSVLASTPASCLNNGQQQVKCMVENSTIVHARNNTYSVFLIKTRTSTLFSLPEPALTYNFLCVNSFFVYPHRHEWADWQYKKIVIAQTAQFVVWNYNTHQISCIS